MAPENRVKVFVGTACLIAAVSAYYLTPEVASPVLQDQDPQEEAPPSPVAQVADTICWNFRDKSEAVIERIKKLCGGQLPSAGRCFSALETKMTDLGKCPQIIQMRTALRGTST